MTRTETAQWLKIKDNYMIFTHRNPDGDTIGCAVALCRGLRKLGKTAWVFENPQFTPRMIPYLNGLTKGDISPDATLVSVDMASTSLLPTCLENYKDDIQLAIDHHGSHVQFAKHLLLESETAACGEIVYQVLLEMGVAITKEMADAIYIAISTDTGCFQFSNTTSQTLRIAAALKDAGCDGYDINKLFFGTKSMARLYLEAHLTQTTSVYGGGTVALCHLPLSLMKKLSLKEDDIDSISGFARDIEGVKVGIMIRELSDRQHKLSLRTSPMIDASAICARLGGGGHRAAAGATVNSNFVDTKAAILEAIAKEGVAI